MDDDISRPEVPIGPIEVLAYPHYAPSASTILIQFSNDNSTPTLQRCYHSTCNPYFIYNLLSYHHLSSSYCAFVSTLSLVSVPTKKHQLGSFRFGVVASNG